MKITKEQEKTIINKAVEYMQHNNMLETEARLYSFIFGYLPAEEIEFSEVFLTVRRVILTIVGVLEDITNEK